MAGLRFSAQTVEIATGVTKKTVLQIVAPTNHRVVVREISISFDGITNIGAPILVNVERQTTAGDGGTSLVLKKMNDSDSEVIQTTARFDINGTAQPVAGDELIGENVHPQGGFTWQAPFGGEIIVPGGGRLGIALTAGATVNAKVRFIAEE